MKKNLRTLIRTVVLLWVILPPSGDQGLVNVNIQVLMDGAQIHTVPPAK